jgi:hypothetical protein
MTDFFGKATGRFWELGAQSQELGVVQVQNIGNTIGSIHR